MSPAIGPLQTFLEYKPGGAMSFCVTLVYLLVSQQAADTNTIATSVHKVASSPPSSIDPSFDAKSLMSASSNSSFDSSFYTDFLNGLFNVALCGSCGDAISALGKPTTSASRRGRGSKVMPIERFTSHQSDHQRQPRSEDEAMIISILDLPGFLSMR